MFYLAQSYLHAGLPKAALVVYEARVAMEHTWTEEKYVSLRRLIELVPSPEKQLAYAWQALELNPGRLEAPYALLRSRRVAGLPFTREVFVLAREASITCGAKRKPPAFALFSEVDVYAWRFDDEFSIAAHRTGHYFEGLVAAGRCLRDGSGLPDSEIDRVKEIYRLCAERC